MIYVFDSGPMIVLFQNYYPNRFPTLWDSFDNLVSNASIVSVREVYNELVDREDRLSEWAKSHKVFYSIPTVPELDFVKDIFSVAHFQAMIRKKERLQGKPVADPFVIAKAKIMEACVVTQEKIKENAAQIPNVCEHFKGSWINLEGFMEKEDWKF